MQNKAMTIRLYGTADDSIVDGVGLRYAVFTQGCPHRCVGCHNPESQTMDGGTTTTIDALEQQILDNKLIQGVTLSGGEPFTQCEACLELAKRLKQHGYDLWIYSGYTFDQLMQGTPDPLAPQLLQQCNVLVDGPFVQSLHDHELKWKGSSNQRVIDLGQTFEQDKIVLWQDDNEFPEVPASW